MTLNRDLRFSLPVAARVGALVVAAFITLAAPRAASADFLNPFGFSSLGTLNLSAGTYTLNTTTMELRDPSNALLFTGILYNQGTPANAPYYGYNPNVAVFTFDSITLAAFAAINVTGVNPLAMLSRTTVEFASNSGIVAVGQKGGASTDLVPGIGGQGGPGGGQGGDAAARFVVGGTGEGPGGGAGSGPPVARGVGGSFGGRGGNSVGGFGAPAYGDLHEYLQAGSGGGGVGGDVFRAFGAAGGGGGGAVELGAAVAMTFGAVNSGIDARGGANGAPPPGVNTFVAGGGSGGGILIHAPTITGGGFNVTGGNPNAAGGRILVLNDTASNAGNSGFAFGHGSGGGGENGILEFGFLNAQPVPEPSTLTMLSIGLAFGGIIVRRRHRRGRARARAE